MVEYFGGRVGIVAHKEKAARAFGDAGPSERRRDIVTVAGIFLWNVSSLSKGGARKPQRHVSLRVLGGALTIAIQIGSSTAQTQNARTDLNQRAGFRAAYPHQLVRYGSQRD